MAEIGIGNFPDVALALKERGVKIFATDIRPYVYDGIDVFIDDVTDLSLSLYRGTDLIYSMRTPAELVPSIEILAGRVSADALIRPLTSEFPEGWKLMKYGNSAFFMVNHICRK